jgi:hypothetical protein
MRLLKQRPDGDTTDDRADDAVAETTDDDAAASDPRASGAKPRWRERAFGGTGERRWGRRTVTVPMTVPERAVRRTAVIPTRSVDRGGSWARLTLGPLLALIAGAALAVVGAIALIRTGVDESWFRPQVEVLNADHTALLGAAELGAGLVLLLAGVTGSRVVVAILGVALAIGATAIAIDPAEVQRELAIERWWAWTLAVVGVVLALAALQAPLERRRAVVDVP